MKKLNLTYEGVDYTLEYTRTSIKNMERNNFDINDLQKKPLTTLPKLFHGAFQAHHPRIKQELTDKILDNLTNKEGLIGKLAEMYSEPIAALLEDPEVNEGNATWEANW